MKSSEADDSSQLVTDDLFQNLTWPLETCNGSFVDCNLTNSSSSAEGPWYRYNLYVNVVLCIAYGLVFIFGLVGNLLVAVAVLRSKKTRRCVTDLFLVNLALADLLVILACLPFNLVSNLVHPWVLGPVICKLLPYLQGVSVCASVYTLVAVAVERCYSICWPWKGRLCPATCRKIIVLIWIWAGAITLPWMVVFQLNHTDQMDVCTEQWSDPVIGKVYFILAHLTLCYMAPLFIIVMCYAFVWRRVWYRRIPCETTSSPQLKDQHPSTMSQLHRSKVRALRMLLAVVTAFALAWLPLYLTFGILKLGPAKLNDEQSEFWDIIVPIVQWLGSSNSCVNPILYHFLDPRFRSGFRTALLCRDENINPAVHMKVSRCRLRHVQQQQPSGRMQHSGRLQSDVWV